MSKEEIATIPGLEGMISTQRPEGTDDGYLGTEHIGRDDMTIPRLALAQKTSPEIDPTQSARFIDGLRFTDMFNSITRQSYGRGPVLFSILRGDKPRWVEFIPLAEGGGVRDPNVRPFLDDGQPNPKTQYGEVDPATGKQARPQATKFYDFIVLVLNDLDIADPLKNVMALSMKSSAIKVAKQINFLTGQRGKKKLYKGIYELKSDSDTKNGNTYAIYKVQNAGWMTPGSPLEAMAADMFELWKDREVKIDLEGAQERVPGEDDDFPAVPAPDQQKM